MNLRLSPEGFRFRVSGEELKEVLQGSSLQFTMDLPAGGRKLRVTVEAASGEPELVFEGNDIRLKLPLNEVRRLSELPPSKDLGFQFAVPGTATPVAFEVDFLTLRKRDRREATSSVPHSGVRS